MFILAGCRSTTPLPPMDLTKPGWTVREGQAVWAAARGEPGIAGELLVALRADGACFVQFAKPPFTLVTARAEFGAWSVHQPQRRRQAGGRGRAPDQWVWFALVESMTGTTPGSGWRWEARAAGAWRLANPATGETLEGYLTP